MSDGRTPQVGDALLIYPGEGAIEGTITYVWGDGYVNVLTNEGRHLTSMRYHGGSGRGSKPYCEPRPTELKAQKPAPKFRFELGSTPAITVSGEIGLVVARAEYLNSEPSYLLQYRRNDGVGDEQWWRESALS